MLKAQHGLSQQHTHPLGLLSVLPILSRHPRSFLAIMEAAQGFDTVLLKRIKDVPAAAKQIIVNRATQPLTLRHLVRCCLRQYLQPHLALKVPQLEIPTTLHAYLLFEIS